MRRWPSPKGLGKSHTAQSAERVYMVGCAPQERAVHKDDAMPVDAMIAGALPLPYFGWRGALGEWASVFGVGSGAG